MIRIESIIQQIIHESKRKVCCRKIEREIYIYKEKERYIYKEKERDIYRRERERERETDRKREEVRHTKELTICKYVIH